MIAIAEPDVREPEKRRVEAVLDSGALADGERVRTFESEFALYCGADHGVATSNGTTALTTALRALGIGPGDRVVTTPFSFIATANAVRLVGAEPVFADVDPETYDLDPGEVERIAREENVDAILAVHLYGLPADVDRLADVADDHDLLLVEDAAQAHGARYDGQPVGSFGDAACFSFYPTKNMTTGEGGMVLTSRDDVAERAREFVDHGRTQGYEHASVGHNFRMTNLAAAMGSVQLARLPQYVEQRRQNAARLDEALADAPVTTPTEPADRTHAYNQYTVRTSERETLRDHLESEGVASAVYYPIPIHRQPAYEGFDASAPNADEAAEEVLSLPVHPGLDSDDVDVVAETLRAHFARRA